MSTATFVTRQAAQPHLSQKPQPHKSPMQLAGRLLAQFEEDLRAGDNRRANLVNEALLELQQLMSADQARQVEREISDAWCRVCGWSF